MKETLREGFWHIRTALAGLLVLAIVALALLALRGSDDGTPVLLTQAEIGYGRPFAEGKPRLLVIPAHAVPDGAQTDLEWLSDKNAARYIPRGSILTEADMIGSPHARQLGHGTMLLNLVVPTSAATGFTVGDTMDIWGHDGQCTDMVCPPRLLAEEAEVMRISESAESGWGSEESVGLAVAVNEEKIGTVLAAVANGSLSLALRAVADP